MRRLLIALICLCAFVASANAFASSSSSALLIGTFSIDGTNHGGFLLSDGHVYKPVSSHQKENMETWELKDSIMVLKLDSRNRYLLVNSSTGTQAKAKIVGLKN